jgi:hypothetical protein
MIDLTAEGYWLRVFTPPNTTLAKYMVRMLRNATFEYVLAEGTTCWRVPLQDPRCSVECRRGDTRHRGVERGRVVNAVTFYLS